MFIHQRTIQKHEKSFYSMEEVFANNVLDNGHQVSRVYGLLYLNNENINNSTKIGQINVSLNKLYTWPKGT